ncbi:hypothetical protein OG453_44500 [Streptomyces sp. NBC_01381]|uniref:hypothetical protein n=1 Tax=Streptomyces sp. NBC_01381 TaxID=2903845 RepID=UPI002257C890|nr:hypothetical protein [Streptomyces sp. NBC_01381]MCX4673620.1 hypothetical protein [Streptomyces sp. NBC_01381]
MNLLRSRGTLRNLPPACSSADIARMTGLSKGRITQLRSPGTAGTATPLPVPDAEDSTEERPLWRGRTVARWCAASGRRLPVHVASWLLPGPDGPHLEHSGQRTVQLCQEPGVDADMRRAPVDVHVASYTPHGGPGSGPSLWLATVMAPGESARLLGWPPAWPYGSPLQHLVHELLAGLDPYEEAQGALLGTLVILPTEAEPSFSSYAGLVRLLDLHRSDTTGADELKDLVDRMRQVPAGADEFNDIAAAIGHRLPWWPAGCATPPLVTAWRPGIQLTEPLPPPLAEADAFRRRCEASADRLTGDLAASVRELGDSRWGQASDAWRPGALPDRTALPADCDESVWQVPVRFTLAPEQHAYNGDFWQGLRWLMEHAPSQRLARDAHRIFGDPDSARTVVIDTAQLPACAAPRLTEAVKAAPASGSYRAQLVLDALDAHPLGAAGAVLGTWPAFAGPGWCATAPGTSLVALHVPRALPAFDTTMGAPLETVMLRTVKSDGRYGPAPVIALVVTDQDQLVVLPECGDAADLAAAIEHVVWHPVTPVHLVGLAPSMNEELTGAVKSLIDTTTRSTPWEQLTRLVGPHPEDGYCMYCRKRS